MSERDPKYAKAAEHAKAAAAAARRMSAALKRGEWPAFEDAKILEAAGSHARKNRPGGPRDSR